MGRSPPKAARLSAHENTVREARDKVVKGLQPKRRENEETRRVVTDRIRNVGHDQGNDTLDAWVRQRITLGKIKDDFTDEEYDTLIKIARQASRANGVVGDSMITETAASLRGALSLRIGDSRSTTQVRGTFDPIIPDIGALQQSGLTSESRHFARMKYKRSTDPNINTICRHWFTFCLTVANISPVRPRPGLNADAAEIEEDIAIHFASYLARTCIGTTVSGYISNWKRWHKGITGYDPVSSSISNAPMLAQTLAGIRAELPSQNRRRFAHPTHLFAIWWQPLTKPNPFGGPSIMDMKPRDLSHLSFAERQDFAQVLRSCIQSTGMPWEDFQYLVLSAVMTAGLMRISEAVPAQGADHPPINWSDVDFVWNADGSLRRVDIKMLPLKKRKGTQKATVRIAYSLGNIRAAFFLWLLSAVDPVPDEQAASTLAVGRNLTFGGLKQGPMSQDHFRKWYQAKAQACGIKHWKHFNTHSFRIGGATALFAANVSMDIIKAMGRWDGETVRIYSEATQRQLADVSIHLDTIDARPFLDADDGFFDRLAGVSDDQADDWAAAMVEEVDGDFD